MENTMSMNITAYQIALFSAISSRREVTRIPAYAALYLRVCVQNCVQLFLAWLNDAL